MKESNYAEINLSPFDDKDLLSPFMTKNSKDSVITVDAEFHQKKSMVEMKKRVDDKSSLLMEDKRVNSRINLSLDEQDLLCPILQDIFFEPVLAADGHTYEKKSFTEWIRRGNDKSPLTGQRLFHTKITDNLFAKKIIYEYQKAVPKDYQLKQAGIKRDLDLCIKEKEKLIHDLLAKLDNFEQEKEASIDIAVFSLKQKNEELENQIAELHAYYKEKIIVQPGVSNQRVNKEIDFISNKSSAKNSFITLLFLLIVFFGFLTLTITIERFTNNTGGGLDLIKNNINKCSDKFDNILQDSKKLEKSIYKYSSKPTIQFIIGHTSSVRSLLKFSDNIIISGSCDKTIIIWKQENGQLNQLQTLTGHDDCVDSLYKISENIFASRAENSLIKLWTEENGFFKETEIKNTEQNHPSGSLIKISDELYSSPMAKGFVKLWKFEDGYFKEFQTLPGNNEKVSSVLSFSQDTIITGSYKFLIVWKLKNGFFKDIQTISNFPSHIESIVKISDILFATASSNKITLFLKKENEQFIEYHTNEALVSSMMTLSENVIATTYDYSIKLWRRKYGLLNEIQNIQLEKSAICFVKLFENVLAISSKEYHITLFTFDFDLINNQ